MTGTEMPLDGGNRTSRLACLSVPAHVAGDPLAVITETGRLATDAGHGTG
jgi:hypothetical protein